MGLRGYPSSSPGFAAQAPLLGSRAAGRRLCRTRLDEGGCDAIFEYAQVQDTPIRVRMYDNVGNVLFEQTENYSGEGVESIH